MVHKPDPDRPISFCVHGIERSGTNWLELLLESGFGMKATFNRKHWRIVSQKLIDYNEGRYENQNHIFVIKNPWAWYNSFKLVRKSRIESQFNTTDSKIENPNIDQCFDTYWSPTNESFIEFLEKHPKRSLVITHEEIINNGWSGNIERISNYFGLKIKSRGGEIKHKTVTANRKVSKRRFDPGFYRSKKYLEAINKEQKKWIKDNASKKVMDYCNFYEILED